jgi:5'(3')-deoxyribonucleotidase
MKLKRRIFLDFDQSTTNSIQKVCELYNEDFSSHPNFIHSRWEYVNDWNFVDECKLITRKEIDAYFESERFFTNLQFMDNGEKIIKELSEDFDIHIVSMGTEKNIKLSSTVIKSSDITI